MTCKDCLHNNVCYLQEVCNDIQKQLDEFGCDDFKDKSNIIELPCKVYSVEYDCYFLNEYFVNEINLNNVRAFTDKKKAEKVVWELNR